jgi:hypothetical protein
MLEADDAVVTTGKKVEKKSFVGIDGGGITPSVPVGEALAETSASQSHFPGLG